jgi:hypothetical protein
MARTSVTVAQGDWVCKAFCVKGHNLVRHPSFQVGLTKSPIEIPFKANPIGAFVKLKDDRAVTPLT